ncbi:MAG: hypothetical protein CBC16_06100 [Verrucomicrobia bacterium TMED56]|jgi:hypothetical protein|nr:MAG: hypothetical protein CBC16_06100 [Verrucomicrobia bacterium TMED56]
MRIYVSRSGQTFGPYTIEEAKSFLGTNQLLASDFALIEGSSEWKSLPEILSQAQTDPQPEIPFQSQEKLHVVANQNQEKQKSEALEESPKVSESKIKKKSDSSKKVQKIRKSKGGQIIMVAQEKSFFSKILSVAFIFILLFLLAIGGIVGAYFAMPSKVGPILGRFGLEMDNLIEDSGNESSSSEMKNPSEIMLSEDSWNTLRSSGIRIQSVVGEKGVQVISSVDPDLAMKDDDLEKLMIIAPHIISLDLTDSKVTNAGLEYIVKMPNLKKLVLEGTKGVDSSAIFKLKTLSSLQHLNLIRLKLDPTAIDALIGLEPIQEVYLFETGLGEADIKRLKNSRPKVFINSG